MLKDAPAVLFGLVLIVPTGMIQYTSNRVLESVETLTAQHVESRKDIQHVKDTIERMQLDSGNNRRDVEDLKIRVAIIEQQMRGVGIAPANQ